MYPFAMYPYAIIALDLANERAREAAHDRLVAEARAERPVRNSLPRRALANGLALVSRGSAPPSAGSTNASPTTSDGAWLRRSRLTA